MENNWKSGSGGQTEFVISLGQKKNKNNLQFFIKTTRKIVRERYILSF